MNVIQKGDNTMLQFTEMLAEAQKQGYAIGSFSPRYITMIEPVMRAAIQCGSHAIVQISEKELSRHQVDFAAFAKEFYRVRDLLEPTVSISLHLDHTKTIGVIEQAVECKFHSVMIDASEHDFDKNADITKQVVAYCHPKGVYVEAELGKIGTTDFAETDTDEELFTNPTEAQRFCEITGVDALAVSVGTAHGMYTVRKPRVDLARLEAINKLTNVPLVLHGGSDVPNQMILDAVKLPSGGVCKVNIATDLEQAMLKSLGEKSHITQEKLSTYDEASIKAAQEAVFDVVKDKICNYLGFATRQN